MIRILIENFQQMATIVGSKRIWHCRCPKKPLLFLIVLFFQTVLLAQDDALSSDELFQKARTEAFDNNDYGEAIRLMKIALEKSPNYTDLRIFLGRLYTWTDQTDLARTHLKTAFENDPSYVDAAMAYANLEYWNDDSTRALEIVNMALDKNPDDEGLLILKSKILKDLKKFQEANNVLNKILGKNPKSTEARSLLQSVQMESANNQIGASYDFVYFDERFDQPWHLASLDYARQTKLGSITGRINYANRFGTGSTQFEVDLYPRISNTFYAYLNGGISNDEGIFPEYRTGFSLYANLPAAFEADAGFRLLIFSDNTWVYTFGVGKYYKNYWFNFRTYLTPSDVGVSNSYAIAIRYYFGGADDYFRIKLGTGFSPDDTTTNVLINNASKLRSNNVSLGYRTLLGKTNVIFTNATYENIEYAADSKGNQFTIGLGYIKRF